MKVKLLVGRSGLDFVQSRGELVDVSDAEGARLIAAGQAEPVRAAPVERATPRGAAAEKAVK